MNTLELKKKYLKYKKKYIELKFKITKNNFKMIGGNVLIDEYSFIEHSKNNTYKLYFDKIIIKDEIKEVIQTSTHGNINIFGANLLSFAKGVDTSASTSKMLNLTFDKEDFKETFFVKMNFVNCNIFNNIRKKSDDLSEKEENDFGIGLFLSDKLYVINKCLNITPIFSIGLNNFGLYGDDIDNITNICLKFDKIKNNGKNFNLININNSIGTELYDFITTNNIDSKISYIIAEMENGSYYALVLKYLEKINNENLINFNNLTINFNYQVILFLAYINFEFYKYNLNEDFITFNFENNKLILNNDSEIKIEQSIENIFSNLKQFEKIKISVNNTIIDILLIDNLLFMRKFYEFDEDTFNMNQKNIIGINLTNEVYCLLSLDNNNLYLQEIININNEENNIILGEKHKCELIVVNKKNIFIHNDLHIKNTLYKKDDDKDGIPVIRSINYLINNQKYIIETEYLFKLWDFATIYLPNFSESPEIQNEYFGYLNLKNDRYRYNKEIMFKFFVETNHNDFYIFCKKYFEQIEDEILKSQLMELTEDKNNECYYIYNIYKNTNFFDYIVLFMDNLVLNTSESLRYFNKYINDFMLNLNDDNNELLFTIEHYKQLIRKFIVN